MTKRFDVVGIGNAIVDVFCPADDGFLDLMGITRGIMQLVERDRGELLYAAMKDRSQAAGGSVGEHRRRHRRAGAGGRVHRPRQR